VKLERVDIFGFKSFAERTELVFHEGVTAIVGPNGCGKSNISDAIGWALGEQSAKSLRGKKMEDFIFTGSESRPPVGVAEVNLRLSQVNGDPTGATRQVIVTRRLYRSGESEYLMDGTPCRLRDINEIFMDTGVGTKAYSIIEQGKIGLILSGKPTDRRAIIEEAAGITKYKARRRSAELKLQAAQQNLLRVNDIVYEVERQMNSLKRQAGKARRYHRLREGIVHLEKIDAVKKNAEIEGRLVGLRAKAKALSDEELRRSTSLSVAENHLERLRLEQAETESELASLREALHRNELHIERLENQIGSNRQQLGDLDERRKQLTVELEELEGRFGPSSKQLALRLEDEASVREELSHAEDEASSRQQELSRASFSLAEAEREIEEGRGELVHRISKIAALKNFLQGVVTQNEKVTSEILKLEEEVRELETERGRFEHQRKELEDKLSQRKERTRFLATEREQLEKETEERISELGQIDPDMSRRREELSELNGRLDSLEELVGARAHFGAGARHLLTLSEVESLPHLVSVADSVEVDSRFERAAEHFLGGWLQRIVVATEEDALAARARLEEDGAGRCEFLIESMASRTARAIPDQVLENLSRQRIRGVVGLLSDRVRWTNGKSELLNQVLPDAVVMEDLQGAIEAFHLEPRVPFVTLYGDVIRDPGVLSAGPGGPSEGLLSTRREIRELRETLSRATVELEALGKRRQQVLDELDSRKSRLAGVVDDQHALDKEMVGLEHQRHQLDEELDRAERKAQVLASEREQSESERGLLGTKRLEMEQSLLVEEETKEKTEIRLDELRSVLGDQRIQVEELQGRAREEASQVAALRERAQAVKLDVERLREGVSELESRLKSLGQERIDLDEKEKHLQQELARAEADVKESLAERDRQRESSLRLDRVVTRHRARGEETDIALKHRRRELEEVRDARSSEEISLAREESEINHLRSSFAANHGIPIEEASALLNPADLARDDVQLTEELEDLKRKLDAIGPVNPMADEEYQELHTRHEFLTTQRQDLLDSISTTETAIRRIDTTSRQKFQEAFTEINQRFDVTFKQLFGGGRASLSLIDEDDILESGIDINAQPPGKRLQNVLLLSGGEKALTAIALMFAIFMYKPSPFCLLDEVDAPLDDANVGRFISMLADLRNTTQFIVITHNRKTMEIADQMYGVTMEEPGISKLVSVRLIEGESAEEFAAPS
jgi:chromosome segregation protein